MPPRVSFANNTDADIFVSIHANASRGNRRDVNGLETYYYSGYKGLSLAMYGANTPITISNPNKYKQTNAILFFLN